ncbi:ISNCY family insertion sequence transposase domain-containing protein (plasmid) [Sinorhizobium fredii]|uniref:ISNCY family insertion sequence transposase domain-containing protein n=1 Tax=Rhizobium fredii TaxID=380 RepID=A0A2L0HC39_RHIFR|nr:ISNCY family insertion sequence transposase domain-containing protein [Sinorhizobium fredii]
MIEENEVTRGLVGRNVETYAIADGRLDVRRKGHSMPYKTFDKDQRVTHAAITENKRLSDVLAYIKERQDQLPSPKVRTNSEKNGYTPTGLRNPDQLQPIGGLRQRTVNTVSQPLCGLPAQQRPAIEANPSRGGSACDDLP